jgi:hypothetical protein
VLLPQFLAMRLSLQVSGNPMYLMARINLLSRRVSSFSAIDKMLLVKVALRMLRATLIVKSISALSILGRALNQTPARIALSFIFTSCILSTDLPELLSIEKLRTLGQAPEHGILIAYFIRVLWIQQKKFCHK